MSTWKIFLIGFLLSFSTSAQTENGVLSAEKIVDLIPNKFGDFNQSVDAQSRLIALGTLKYSMVEKNFVANKKRSIKILLFDYKEALIMYNQATRKFGSFTPVYSDTLVFQSVLMTDCSGWETYNAKRNFSQILLGVCNRFFLTIEGTNVELSELKKVVETFKFESFPKLIVDNPKSR